MAGIEAGRERSIRESEERTAKAEKRQGGKEREREGMGQESGLDLHR